MGDTLFGKIVRKEAPADIVHEDEQAVVIRDVNPQAPTHLLVLPRKPIPKLADAEPGDEALLGHLLRVAHQAAADEGLSDYRVVVNNGSGAGQTIFHLHVHVIGGRPLRWPPG